MALNLLIGAIFSDRFVSEAKNMNSGQGPPQIVSISVCNHDSLNGIRSQGSCAAGTYDTDQHVLGPGGVDINDSALGAGIGPVPDEHSTVYSPGTLGSNQDYLFFLATGLGGNAHIGVSVLSGGPGPDENGTWTLGFPVNDGYGFYGDQWGPVFNPTTKGDVCPNAPGFNKLLQDETFDMHYAASGSVVKDPTSPDGSLLMVYEGTNACIGNNGQYPLFKNDDYISLAIATSTDYGKRWPTYRGTPHFDFVPMPDVNQSEGPRASMGKLWPDVCIGNDCCTSDPCPETPPAGYGRYPVVTPIQSLEYLMGLGNVLPDKYGEQEISGFVDDVAPGPTKYIYANSGNVRVSQAALNGMSDKLDFHKWDGNKFGPEGLGGDEVSVLPTGPFANCEDPDPSANQNQFGSSISYFEQTNQYLLTFVCVSKGDPAYPQGPDNAIKGAAWFWSTTSDLTTQAWSPPAEIEGSWSAFTDTDVCSNFDGFYPTFMSPGKTAGHLGINGYVFYLHGCQPGGTPEGRFFSSRSFKISIRPK
jgi:hypothetical protein